MPLSVINSKDLPVEDDISLHRKGWVIQRIGWVVLFCFLILAALGLFGEGPLSSTQMQAQDISFRYERFVRYEHGFRFQFQSAGESMDTVSIPQVYLKVFRLMKVVPEPLKEITSPGYLNFVFEGRRNAVITFYLNPIKTTRVSTAIKVNSHIFQISQIIYP